MSSTKRNTPKLTMTIILQGAPSVTYEITNRQSAVKLAATLLRDPALNLLLVTREGYGESHLQVVK